MSTIEMEVFAKYRKEIEELKATNAELLKLNAELEQRLQDLYGEYMLLRYKLRGMPSHSEILRLREEMMALRKELHMCESARRWA